MFAIQLAEHLGVDACGCLEKEELVKAVIRFDPRWAFVNPTSAKIISPVDGRRPQNWNLYASRSLQTKATPKEDTSLSLHAPKWARLFALRVRLASQSLNQRDESKRVGNPPGLQHGSQQAPQGLQNTAQWAFPGLQNREYFEFLGNKKWKRRCTGAHETRRF